MIITGARDKLRSNPSYYHKLLSTLPSDYVNPYISKIELDVTRSFQHKVNEVTNEEHLTKLRNILQSFTIRNPTLGYCQGFNIILARLLQITEYNEEESFWLLVCIIEDVFPLDFFMNSAGLETDCDLLMEIISSDHHDLVNHLTLINSSSILFSYIMKWLISIFITGIDFDISNIIMDLVFLNKNSNTIFAMYNCTCGLINIMKDELMKADSIESVGLVYTKYLQQENADEKIKQKVIHDLIYDIMDNKERFTLSDSELWNERTKRVEVVFNNSKQKKAEKENELKLNETKWKEINEKKCDKDWPICVKDIGYKWDAQHYLIYTNNLENKGYTYVSDYFFTNCDNKNVIINSDDGFKGLSIERKTHSCTK